MDKVTIDGLELNSQIVKELKSWFEPGQSIPEQHIDSLADIKNTLIVLFAENENESHVKPIQNALLAVLTIEKTFLKLIN